MDTFESALELVPQGGFSASVDLSNAYYSVCVAEEHRKYLRFIWRNKVYQYTCLAHGLASAARILTKLLKPVLQHLEDLDKSLLGISMTYYC